MLEGQWVPEETSWKALAMRSVGDYGVSQEFSDYAKEMAGV